MMVLPDAWRMNHRTGQLGVIDVAANTYSVTPVMGSLAGDQAITIRGAGYSGEAAVRVGGTPCRVLDEHVHTTGVDSLELEGVESKGLGLEQLCQLFGAT